MEIELKLKCKKYFIKYFANIKKGNTSQFTFDGDSYYSFNKENHQISGKVVYCLKSDTCVGFSEKEIFTFFYTEAEVRQQKISSVIDDNS